MFSQLRSKIKHWLRPHIINLLRPEFNRFNSKLTEIDEFFLIVSEEAETTGGKIAALIESQKKQTDLIKSELAKLHDHQENNQQIAEKNHRELKDSMATITKSNEKLDYEAKKIKTALATLQKELAKTPEAFTRLDNLEKHIRLLSDTLNEKTQADARLRQFLDYKEQDFETKTILEKTPPFDYLQFENQFRGEESTIQERQKYYLKYFEGCERVLDIGCGRGEFLELAQKNDIGAIGIDLETNMQIHCRQKGIEITQGDVFSYLLAQENNSFDGIFSSQVMEHLSFRQLQQLAHLIHQKLQPGSYAVLETINPLCPLALQHFYTDLTHQKPLFPRVMRFLFENYGLSYVHTIYSVPIDPSLPSKTLNQEQAAQYLDYAIVIKKNHHENRT